MPVKILCDAFVTSGLGHVRRCEKILSFIEKLGVEADLYLHKQNNISAFLEGVGNDDFLIADSYCLNSKDFYLLKEKAKSLMVIEDKEHTKGFYPKNTKILNFTLNALKHYNHASKDHYLGVGFYPVDARFIYERPINTANKEALITLGGSEQKTLEEIVKILENKNVNLHIISPHAPKNPPKNTHYYSPLSPLEFSSLMKFCACAISAAGQTLYELALSQTPSLILPIASNQIIQSQEFENSGIFKQTSLKTLARDFEKLQIQKNQAWAKNLAFGSELEGALREFLEI
ncbi:CMP-N-acetylneuraminic acid synthetase [Helicobacter pylori]|uniref:CMP-N-acetylneuraminic acid synthetase n=1 Tax=Helicobacter pylori TaxID=210 RepID=UPI000BEEE08C|nr:CMP-N-acetylneuraminic acid synthetase [Helicobacter pylori]OPG39565.1 CMP-N-acetylneuraminic acid synthetase [Helicobacter pylori]OPG52407.1 CMP-N-acetylneuraminic acid synthetase [Helicobacter pylori]